MMVTLLKKLMPKKRGLIENDGEPANQRFIS